MKPAPPVIRTRIGVVSVLGEDGFTAANQLADSRAETDGTPRIFPPFPGMGTSAIASAIPEEPAQ